MTDGKLLKCAWLTDDDGGRCGGSAVFELGGGCVRILCEGCGLASPWVLHGSEPDISTEWNRNQRALTDGPDAAAWFEETQSSLLLVQEVEEQRDELRGALSDMTASRDESLKTLTGVYEGRTIAIKQRDELRREVERLKEIVQHANRQWRGCVLCGHNSMHDCRDGCTMPGELRTMERDAWGKHRDAMKGKDDED